MPSDPKVFFANERTFLAWTRTAGTVAIAGLLIWRYWAHTNNEAEKLTGLALIAIGVATMLYALVQFRRRADRLTNRDGGSYLDQIGPFFITISFVIVVVARFISAIFEEAQPPQ